VRLLSALLAGILLALAAATLATAIWGWLGPIGDTAAEGGISARRVGLARFARSALTLCFAAAYALLLRRSRPPLLVAAGFVPTARAARSYAVGFLAGVLPVVVLVAALVLLGARTVEVRAPAGKLAWLAIKFVLLGLPLVAIEEGLFRGLLLGDLVRAFGVRAAVVAGSLFFACTHVLGAPESWRARPDPPGAVEAVLANFAGLERMLREWPEIVGLFLVGAILSVVRLRSGAVWLGMGIHAGWYWVRSMDRWFVREVDAVIDKNRIWLGSSQYHDGVIGWLALAGTLALALAIRLTPSRSPDPERAVP
jgi:membrane protease YdiL (CAAX protease family)